MVNSCHTDYLAQAKKVAADVKAGLATKEALLSFLEAASDPRFSTYLERLDPNLFRFINLVVKGRVSGKPVLHSPQGTVHTLYVSPFPREGQLRVAYEVGLNGFLEYLESKGYAVLEKRETWLKLYEPRRSYLRSLKEGIQKAWEEYLSQILSLESLLNNLGVLISSLKRLGLSLSDSSRAGSGISLPDVPVPNKGVAFFLLAWCLAEEQISESDLGQLPSEKRALVKEAAEKLKGGRGRYLLGKSYAKAIRKRAKELIRCVEDNSFDPWPRCVLSPEVPFLLLRDAGDAQGSICYGCGHALPRSGGSLRAYKISKIVFSKPTVRRQSDYDGTDNKARICDLCAVLSLASPLKLAQGSVLVRVGHLDEGEIARHFVRSAVLGTLHVAAGRYIQLNSPILTRKSKPLAQELGRVVYALQALGQEVNPKVLERFPFYLVEGAQEIPLPPRALWLSHVLQRAFASRPDEGGEVNRPLGEALRYALGDLPWHALYTLARRYGRVADRFSLEDGLMRYASLLEKEVGMKENTDLSQRFRDVAGLTGLLSAWVGYVEGQVGRNSQEAKRAVVKLLDNLERPGDFLYVAAYHLDSTQARLYEAGGAFFYQEAKRLLQEAGARAQEAEEGSGRFLNVSQDDLHRVYAHLAARYPGKAWEGFIYEVRLSLASRFPQYIRMEKEG
ncbi:hypothetical protein TTHNP4_00407 (plasmid) [Thermus thermophilus]|uniref:Uncharacterized protein n=1 Tax=Thermus thermophilus TaxID=274 RepID=A0A3P4AV30_THETH|nr:hypothetical protein TTHNP4_00407 [Thermus thermophilus]